ncbi:MAG: hypothetical protein HYS14_02385 [Candidatus Rokubacteria bacterium]|nr:hypothetical protein [Candidatus Rokubacteria bacterium]
MLNPLAFANSLAVVTAAFYILLRVVALVSPAAFEFLFNAQFLGARVASLLPRPPSFGEFVGTGVTIVVSAWALSYGWAWLYNRFAR